MIRLGAIIAQHSLKELVSVPMRLQDSCELVMLPYHRLHETTNLYRKNQQHVDGFVLTELAYAYLMQEWGSFPIPTYTLQISEQEFYKKLFQLSLRNRDLDFSRVYIDFVFAQNNFLGLKEVVGADSMPYTLSPVEVNDQIYEAVLDEHLRLWQAGKIDFSMTRMSNIVQALTDRGVPHLYVFPSPESVAAQFEQMATELSAIKLAESRIAIGHITIGNVETQKESLNEWELRQMLLHKSLLEFSTEKKVPFIIQKSASSFEIISSFKDLKLLTDNLTHCLLLTYLEKTLPCPVHIGWGVGNSMYKARMNAQSANSMSAAGKTSGTYVVTDSDQVIGPLGEETCLQYRNQITDYIQRWSEETDLSTLQLQKILAVLAKTESNELTADELAYHLGLTVRSANRILNRLEEKGVAKILYKKQEKLRGRPTKIYQIQLPANTDGQTV
ncbi:HTH domain-containing protein [Brevibacillus agri]|uniref:HTH domain-containing protein n=1 Tax=Brevibacillus agri TaxID=51101 RepID=UPI0024C0886E|nr:HTH domain-containing protein [Brevibacillus agri]MED4569378.1 HTH domain-containing protein [Brevibacillus agri]WHX29753.1 HTH domain-containing protein [Brevibacillus agri]